MKTNKVKAIPAAIQTELNVEPVTIDASVLIHEYDLACYAMDDANLAQYNATKSMHGIIEKLVKAGFKTLQSGHNKKKKPKDGEFPYLVAASEFEANYLARHYEQWKPTQSDDNQEYVPPTKTAVDNIVKQKIASLSFLLDYGKYTSNVGKDKPRLIAEVLNEKWLSLLQDKKAAEASATRAAGIAAESKKRAGEIQAAVKLAQATPSTPAAVVETVISKSNEATNKADLDAIAAEAAKNELDAIAAEVAEVEEKKNQAAAVAEVKKSKGKSTTVPSVATAKTGEVDHDTATVISKDASIGRDSAIKVKKAVAAIVDHMSLIEVREVYRALGMVLLDAKMDT